MATLIGEGERHAWTLDELHAALIEQGVSTDFSSVFRAAEKLTADAVLRKFLLNDGRARFELINGHHDHLYCTGCHKLVPVPCLIERERFAALEAATGAAIHDHQIILNGLCRDCRTAHDTGEATA
jgi:Fur family transcriptional regulator, ferric uptake regulator